jgi:hypothetical protein
VLQAPLKAEARQQLESALTHSPTHSPTHTLTHSLAHSLTHSLTYPHAVCVSVLQAACEAEARHQLESALQRAAEAAGTLKEAKVQKDGGGGCLSLRLMQSAVAPCFVVHHIVTYWSSLNCIHQQVMHTMGAKGEPWNIGSMCSNAYIPWATAAAAGTLKRPMGGALGFCPP